MLQDFRFAVRQLMRHRTYASIAILTIALGVGVNTAVFSIADSVLFRPLPFHDVDRLFALRIANPQTGAVYAILPGPVVEAARGTGMFSGMAEASYRTWRAYIRDGGPGLDAITLAPVSREYLELLGVDVMLGRRFDSTDAGTHAIVLTHRAWIRRYGGNPNVVGRTFPAILRSTEAYRPEQPPLRVIGVLPPRVHFPLIGEAEAMVLDDKPLGGTGTNFAPLVRLAPGIGAAAAQARLASLQAEGLTPGKAVPRLVPVREELAARQEGVLWLLLAAAGIVLLVVCVNLANLIIARGIARGRELAVRAALGGSRARVARLLLAEAVCITTIGGALGVFVAYFVFRLLAGSLPPLLARVTEPVFDLRVLFFAAMVTAASTLAFSLWPVARLSRTDAQSGLRSGLERFHALGRGRQLLVGLEIAICVMLMIGAALVGRSLYALASEDLGFEPHRFAVTFDLPTMVVTEDQELRTDLAARSAFHQARLREIRQLPGIHAAALASAVPFSGAMPYAALTERGGEMAGGVYAVSSGYFRTMGIPVVVGRDLTDEESFRAAPVAVLNESAARMLCAGLTSCLGRIVPSPDQPDRTVIGIVRDSRPSLRRPATPIMYAPFRNAFAITTLVIDADGSRATREALQRALSVSPDARVNLESLEEGRDRELSPFFFNAVVIGGFAGLTLVLALIGVAGVMAAAVGERTREFGIRVALGATRARVNRLVLRQAATPIVLGSLCGLAAAGLSVRFIASLLYGVPPLDASSFVMSVVLVTIAGVAAAWPSARRAGRVDPIVCLRAE